jgi:CheY-like chemotaxis protein
MTLPGKGKILVMDDEPVIREVLGEMLTYIGYSVMAAGDGAEAIELYKGALSQSEPFDAVIMDLTIPGGMGGKEAVSQLRKLDPKIKAIVSSGYSNDPIMASFEKHGFAGVASKPYRIEEISKVLHEVITKESRQIE